MRIEDILSRVAIEAVQRPTAQAVGLPSSAYTSSEFLKLEQDLLFASGWIYAGRAAELAKPGDGRPVEIAGKPLILLRNRAGKIKASTTCAATATPCYRASLSGDVPPSPAPNIPGPTISTAA